MKKEAVIAFLNITDVFISFLSIKHSKNNLLRRHYPNLVFLFSDGTGW
ncbi:hypothetical protein HQ545_03030 [Candidatus Woesearchaeota archaeon]|nr:hypothetical protein [Candidatus Woesearchaeota archaeon]